MGNPSPSIKFTRRSLVAGLPALAVIGAIGLAAPPANAATDNSKIAFEFFVAKGLNQIHSAGLVGNFVVESGKDPINPAAKQYSGGPGRGIAQWEGSRRTELFEYADTRGVSWKNLQLQLDFVWKELTSTESRALTKLRETTAVAVAAVAVRQYYERPSVHADQARITAAEAIFERYATGGSSGEANPFPLPAGHWFGPKSQNSKSHSGYNGKDRTEIKAIQAQLNSTGAGLDVDGLYGPASVAAVKSFQANNGLDVDGIVGPMTWAALW